MESLYQTKILFVVFLPQPVGHRQSESDVAIGIVTNAFSALLPPPLRGAWSLAMANQEIPT
jgi:hypothetical protein